MRRPFALHDTSERVIEGCYGATLRVQSRIQVFAAEVQRTVLAGDACVNRSMIGAVIGVQPFSGEGLSGTGPKAGGPRRYLPARGAFRGLTTIAFASAQSSQKTLISRREADLGPEMAISSADGSGLVA